VLLAIGGLVALHLGLTSGAVASGFALDDYAWLAETVRAGDDPAAVLGYRISGFFRPVVNASWWASVQAGGLDPAFHNEVNVALDLVCVLLVFAWAFQLAGAACLGRRGGARLGLATFAAAIFAVHPAHAEVVSWVSARVSSWMTLFVLVSWIAWTEWRQRGGRWTFWASVVAFLLALLSKEEAATALPILVLVDRFALRGREGERSSGRGGPWPFVPFAVLLVAYLVFQLAIQIDGPVARTGHLRTNPIAIAGDVLLRLPRLFLSPKVFAPPFLHLLFGAGVVAVIWKGGLAPASRRLGGVALVAAALALLPSALLDFSVSERRYLYLGTAFAALALAVLADRAWQGGGRGGPGRWIAVVLVLLCVTPQPYRLHRDLRDWDHRALDSALRSAATAIAPRLNARVALGDRIVVASVPEGISALHVQNLLEVFAGVDPSAWTQNADDARRATLVHWNGAAFEFAD